MNINGRYTDCFAFPADAVGEKQKQAGRRENDVANIVQCTPSTCGNKCSRTGNGSAMMRSDDMRLNLITRQPSQRDCIGCADRQTDGQTDSPTRRLSSDRKPCDILRRRPMKQVSVDADGPRDASCHVTSSRHHAAHKAGR